jgi:hypothetical protein
LQDPTFHDQVKRTVLTTADTVQKTGMQGYHALGKQVSTHTGVQLPGATSPLGSPIVQRKEEDYDDFWAENGVKDDVPKKEYGSFAGQKGGSGTSTPGEKSVKKDDEWESW